MTAAIAAILFDKDGTLLDYWQTWVPINREVALFAAGGDQQLAASLLRAGGHDPLTDHVAPGSVLASAGMAEIAACFAAVLGPRTPPRLEAEIDRIFRDGGARHSVLMPGAVATVRALKARGIRVGLASNDSIGGLKASLSRHPGVLELFEFTCGCDSGYGSKPEPGMGLAFAAHLGVPPAACAMVGDSTHDLEMAERAGFGLRIAVLGGTGTRANLAPHADVVLDGIADLLALPALQGQPLVRR